MYCLMASQYCILFILGVQNFFNHHRRLDIPPDSEFIMTTEDVRQSSAMSAIQDLMVSLHQALEQEKKVTSKES